MKVVSHCVVLFVCIGLSNVCLAMDKKDKEVWTHHSKQKARTAERRAEKMRQGVKKYDSKGRRDVVAKSLAITRKESSLECHESLTGDSL